MTRPARAGPATARPAQDGGVGSLQHSGKIHAAESRRGIESLYRAINGHRARSLESFVVTQRAIVGTLAALLAGAAVYAAPSGGDMPTRAKRVIASAPRAIGAFTPATADPRLAATLARAGLAATSFRFTPSDSRAEGNRAITVAVRAGSATGGDRAASAAPAAVSMAPLAYSLGAAVGWKRFALSGDMTKVDLGAQPGSRESFDLGVSYVGNRASARVKAATDRPLATAPRIIGGDLSSYSVDVGGSYSVTRNLDVTAGVRYKSETDRLERLRDNRRDSQAVYLGTAFRF